MISLQAIKESKLANLPNETTIDNVVYEYGDYYYRIKGFIDNGTGKYRVRNDKFTIDGKELKYYYPYKQLDDEEVSFVHEIVLDKESLYFNTNFSFPDLQAINILNAPQKYIFYKECLFEISSKNTLWIRYVSRKDIEEITVPLGFRCLSLKIPANYGIKLSNLKRVFIPSDVRLVELSRLPDNLTVIIDNVEKNVVISNKFDDYTYEFTGKANPVVDFVSDGLECTIINDNEVSIAVIPECEHIPLKVSHCGNVYKVTAISDYGLKDCDLYEFPIADCITKLGFGAFYNAKELREVGFTGSLDIDDFAFFGCKKLRTVKSFNTKGIVNIGREAFSGCEFLDEVIIPNQIGVIKANAFSGCKHLYSITLPEKISKIEDYAFDYNLVNIIFTGDIPQMEHLYNVRNVFFYNMANCKKLRDIFGDKPLRFGCPTYMDYVKVPEGVASINKYSFLYGEAEQYCDAKQSCKMSTHDNYCVYSKNKNLKHIYLPDSIESIEDGSFEYIDSLEDVFIFNGKYDGYNALFSTNENNEVTKLIWVSPVIEFKQFDIEETVDTISKHAFLNARIKEVILHNNKLSVGELAFENSSIKKIRLYPNTELFDRNVFKGCRDLNEIIDQSGKVYNNKLVEEYTEKLNNLMVEADKHIIDIPEGCTDKKIVLSNYYYALVVLACENLLLGEKRFYDSYDGKDKMNVADLFAYEGKIEELLTVNIANPTSEGMDKFVEDSYKWEISTFSFKSSHWSLGDIRGCYLAVKSHDNFVTLESECKLPNISFKQTKS